ncbi:TPA: hypothetical protein DEA21_05110 [Candidatus Uhrbacteria bacterium]|nr:hypothetical protein [Candidatus Uhrbacteria bacterium]HCU31387.1 hypothetical protein [Candidatus Uhrbacteria bacterium]
MEKAGKDLDLCRGGRARANRAMEVANESPFGVRVNELPLTPRAKTGEMRNRNVSWPIAAEFFSGL